MAKIRVTQIKSSIDRPDRQGKILIALGLRKMHQAVEHDDTPAIMGMIRKVNHLVKVEQI